MLKSKVFHKSIKGASHILSGKPCQDYSCSFHDQEVSIVVLCDGHGGSTYFRSDIGAKIAADITIQMLKVFARCLPPSTFKGLAFSITAQPQKNPFIDADGNKVRFEDLGEDQKRLAIQARSFLESENQCSEQQTVIKDLLSQIYQTWISQIEQHVINNPFNRKEKEVLSGMGIEKAYGCTLLAFLQTKEYWLSFHIGDGRIMCCDDSLIWRNPVPEDCACFLNYTTSLCDSNPLIEFRYAFNGIEQAPLAVMLCSDGLDGSLRTNENLQDFYEQIIGLLLDGDDLESELDGYLPSLSNSGNKDDISVAGIVNLFNSDESQLRQRMILKKRNRDIRMEYRSKKSDIESICSRIEVLEMKFEKMKGIRFEKQTELQDLQQQLKDKQREVSEYDNSVDSLKREIKELKDELERKRSELDAWKFTIKNEMAEIEASERATSSDESLNQIDQIDYINW